MKINLNGSFYSKPYPSFNGRADKVIDLLKRTRNLKEVKMTADVAISIYEKLGYTVTNKAGSHMTVRHPNGFVFSIKLPHGGEKNMPPEHIKTIQCAIFEDFPQLVHSLHFHRK